MFWDDNFGGNLDDNLGDKLVDDLGDIWSITLLFSNVVRGA